jgi:hypothetical protein
MPMFIFEYLYLILKCICFLILNFQKKRTFSSGTNEYNRQNNKNNRQTEYKVNPTEEEKRRAQKKKHKL